MKVEILDTWYHPLVGNKMARVRLDGKEYEVLKQGGLQNFWAFQGRTKMTHEEGAHFDAFMGQNWAVAHAKKEIREGGSREIKSLAVDIANDLAEQGKLNPRPRKEKKS